MNPQLSLQFFQDFLPSGISWVCGFLTTFIIYFLYKRRRRNSSQPFDYSTIRILFADFWFEGSLLRKLISLTYFVSLVIFNSVIWNDIFNYKEDNYSGEILLRILVMIMFLVGIRILLEISSSLIKISENTSIIREYLTSKSYSSSLHESFKMSDKKLIEKEEEVETVELEEHDDYSKPR